jgi:hypothetical protein
LGVVFPQNELAGAIGQFKLQLAYSKPVEHRQNQPTAKAAKAA